MNLNNELQALTQNLLCDPVLDYVSQSQVGGLNGLINMGLHDKSPEMRHKVLHIWAGTAMMKIAGVNVQSAKNLTATVTTFLINLIKEPDSTPWRLSAYGQELIERTEARAKELSLRD